MFADLIDFLLSRLVRAVDQDQPSLFAAVAEAADRLNAAELAGPEGVLCRVIAQIIDDIPNAEDPLWKATDLRTAVLNDMAKKGFFETVKQKKAR